ncbi:outer membrane protein [Helicobacter pylori]|uniref:Hop family adhesin SabA n=3 Tax=Helicobacter pylori TaxID=210 RepID=UPI0030C5A2CC
MLHAEDNGFFVSAGYQIGEATQIVKSTGELKRLSDAYENLNNLASQFYTLNNLIQQSNNPTAINNTRNNLDSSQRGLLNEKTNSPAYQAVYLALNAAVGLWNVIAYNVQCGPGNSGQASVIFNDQPGHNSNSINCNLTGYNNGVSGPLSIDHFKQLNDAYQVLQTALKQGIPTLNDTNQKIEVKVTTQTNGQNSKETTTTTTTTNDAQTLLQEANKMISVLTTNCPWVNHNQGQNGGAPWGLDTAGNVCQVFATEFSAVTNMIKNAQEIVAQSKIVSENTQSQINTTNGKVFNPYTDASFAQGMLANAQAQVKMLDLAEQIKVNLSTIPSQFITNYLAACRSDGTTPSQGVTSNTWGAGCAYVEETVTALNNSINYFGTQEQQIKRAQDLAYTLANFSSEYTKLGDNYQAITKALPNFPNALSSLITSKTDPNAPNGIKTTYTTDLNAFNQLQTINQELGRNPFRRVGMIASSTTNNGALNGFGVQAGYKQFFGEKKRWGLRYYGFFDYNHAYIKSNFFNSASDVWTYGVGSDLLFNFINDKNTNFLGKNNKISVGLFGGIALAGTSWLNSQFVNLKTISNVYSAKVNTANFQFLFNLGLRTNLARPKKKDSHHAAQHGMELGVKIPTINTNYYSFLGAQLQYRRLYSVYLNYVFAY